jgi:hypothetical protein
MSLKKPLNFNYFKSGLQISVTEALNFNIHKYLPE